MRKVTFSERRAYEQGKKCFNGKGKAEDNPYIARTDLGKAWLNGFWQTAAEKLSVSSMVNDLFEAEQDKAIYQNANE